MAEQQTIQLPCDPNWALGLHGNVKLDICVVVGHCMEPAIHHHDILFMRKLKPKHGNVVLASVDGKQMIKRYLIVDGKPILRPDNPAYAEPKWEHEMKVLRVVVGIMSRLDHGLGDEASTLGMNPSP